MFAILPDHSFSVMSKRRARDPHCYFRVPAKFRASNRLGIYPSEVGFESFMKCLALTFMVFGTLSAVSISNYTSCIFSSVSLSWERRHERRMYTLIFRRFMFQIDQQIGVR